MKFKPKQYDEIVLVLENESAFYRAYTNPANDTFGKRRSLIQKFLGWPGHPGQVVGPRWWHHSDVEDRDQLRRYFDERYEIPQNEMNVYKHIPTWYEKLPRRDDMVDALRHAAELDFSNLEARVLAIQVAHLSEPPMAIYYPPPTPKEIPMNKTAIEITTVTLVNGRNVGDLSDGEVYNLIAEQEKEIERLEAIKTKPKKLVAEIAKRQAGIAALVAHLDSKEA